MTQQILRKQDGRRIASLEISSAGDGSGTVGTFILPFGLALEDGVSVGIDERTIEDGARFVTCLPVGCVTRLSFAADHLERLGAGNALKVTARTSDTREAVTFTLSLKGFTAAFSRLRELRG
jgi:invasion protein IalB